MAARHVLLAALIGAAFSAQAGTIPVASSAPTTTASDVFLALATVFVIAPSTGVQMETTQQEFSQSPRDEGTAVPVAAGLAPTPAPVLADGAAALPPQLAAVALATNVPEPATGGLMLAGLAGVALVARRRRD